MTLAPSRRRWHPQPRLPGEERAPVEEPPRVEHPPPIFGLLADFWALAPKVASGFWAAVRAAAWSRAVNWRQQLLLFQALKEPHAPDAARPVLFAASDAGETIRLVDDLYAEGLLTRGEATRLQDAILRRVGPTGQWVGSAAVEPERGLDLPAVIEEYWR